MDENEKYLQKEKYEITRKGYSTLHQYKHVYMFISFCF